MCLELLRRIVELSQEPAPKNLPAAAIARTLAAVWSEELVEVADPPAGERHYGQTVVHDMPGGVGHLVTSESSAACRAKLDELLVLLRQLESRGLVEFSTISKAGRWCGQLADLAGLMGYEPGPYFPKVDEIMQSTGCFIRPTPDGHAAVFHATENGSVRNGGARSRRSDERRRKAWEMHKKGESSKRIALELGVSESAVSGYLKTQPQEPPA